MNDQELLDFIKEYGEIGEYEDYLDDLTLDMFDEEEIEKFKKQYNKF